MRVLVTGGGGFIGYSLVKRLVSLGHDVSSFSRKRYPEHLKLGISIYCGDLRNYEEVQTACGNCDIVFHAAAKAGLWGPFNDFYSINVKGTENVIRACTTSGVQKLVYLSSASVVFDGSDLVNADESAPYSGKNQSPYTTTKAGAEQLVLSSDSNKLRTIAIRPHLVWGPGDTRITQGIINRARTGKLKRIGRKDHLIDTTYIENLIDALMLAIDPSGQTPEIYGKAFFISNGEPLKTWDFINLILETAGIGRVRKSIPEPLALSLAWLLENYHRIFNLESEPYLTKLMVKELCSSHWFNISAAKSIMGYSPRVNISEGMDLLRRYFLDGSNSQK